MVESNSITVEGILERIEQMPLLSPCALQLMEVIGDPKHSVNDVVKIVECDPELTAHLLKTVNSASFGLVVEVTSVARAVTYLGERIVVSVALAACSSDLFKEELKGYESGKAALWEHSLKTAIAAREVVISGKLPITPDVAFTAGLLHDIGKSVLSDFMVGMAQPILEKIDDQSVPDYMSGERLMLGMDHCAVGKALAERWSLPKVLVPAMEFHHQPGKAEEKDRPLVYAVHLGDIIAMMGGHGTGADSMGYSLDPDYTLYLEITGDEIGKVMLNVMTEFSKTIKMFS